MNNAYFTGNMADINDTVLARTLPTGPTPPAAYHAHMSIDTNANGVLNFGAVYDWDSAHFFIDSLATYPNTFTEDFDDGVADNWIDDGVHWSVVNQVYYLDCPSFADFISYYDTMDFSDFDYSVDMRMLTTTSFSDTYDRGIVFRYDPVSGNRYECYMQNDGNVYVYSYVGTSGTSLFSGAPAGFNTGVDNWNTLKVYTNGSDILLFVNGALFATISDPTHTTGKIGVMGQGSGGYDHNYEYDNVVVTY